MCSLLCCYATGVAGAALTSCYFLSFLLLLCRSPAPCIFAGCMLASFPLVCVLTHICMVLHPAGGQRHARRGRARGDAGPATSGAYVGAPWTLPAAADACTAPAVPNAAQPASHGHPGYRWVVRVGLLVWGYVTVLGLGCGWGEATWFMGSWGLSDWAGHATAVEAFL
jgi:hypothetical protein